MQQPNKWGPIIVTLIGAVVSFLLDRIIWPDVAGMVAPTGTQLPFLIGISVIESIAFGIGLSFLIFGYRFVKGRGVGDWLTFLSAAWLLVSWWPHDNLHRTMAMNDYWQLVRIEWAFHFTLIVAGVIVASYIWKKFSFPND